MTQAERYMAKAKARVDAMEDERKRSHALYAIARDQIASGRLENALRTTHSITIAPRGSYGRSGLDQSAQNLLLEKVAFKLASQGEWDSAIAVLDGRKVYRREFEDPTVSLRLDYVKTLEEDAALEELADLQRTLEAVDADQDLFVFGARLCGLGCRG